MMKSLFLKQKGSVNGLVVLGVLVLAVALPLSVFLTQKNQENRSSAASKSLSIGICGKSTGEYFSSKPSDDTLCDGGVLVWNDETADDGDWNWTCAGSPDIEDSSVECIAVKQ